jgi:hypothetical protein
MSAGTLRSEALEVGVYPPAAETVAVDGTIGATGNISTGGALRANSLAPVSGTVVTATQGLTVTGVTTCNSHLTVYGRLAVDGFQSANGHLVVPGNITLSGTINGWTPFWVCGIFDGNDLSKLSDAGRYPFTVTRPSGSTVGIFRISWSTPHPLGANYIAHLTGEFGVAMIRRRTDGPNTSTSFDCFCRDPGSMATNVNRIIHFSVYA